MAMRKMQTKSGNKEAGNDETYEVSSFPAFFLLCFFEGVTGSADGADLYLSLIHIFTGCKGSVDGFASLT